MEHFVHAAQMAETNRTAEIIGLSLGIKEVHGNETEAEITPKFGGGGAQDPSETEFIFDRIYVRVLLILIYTIVFCFCFFGNLIVLIVVTLHWRMRSVTKFCLANLAFADFCVGIFCIYQNLSVYLIHSWFLGEFLCKMYQYISTLSHTTSILILMVICVERYLVVQHPFLSKQILTKKRLKVIVAAVWIISGVYCSPRLYYVRTISIPPLRENSIVYSTRNGSLSSGPAGYKPNGFPPSNRTYPGQPYVVEQGPMDDLDDEIICIPQRTLFNSKVFDMINSVVLFLVPLIVMTILYTKICITLWERSDDNLYLKPVQHHPSLTPSSPHWKRKSLNTGTGIGKHANSTAPTVLGSSSYGRGSIIKSKTKSLTRENSVSIIGDVNKDDIIVVDQNFCPHQNNEIEESTNYLTRPLRYKAHSSANINLHLHHQIKKIRSKKVHFKDCNLNSSSIKRCGAFKLRTRKTVGQMGPDGSTHWFENSSSTSATSTSSSVTPLSSSSDPNLRIIIKPLKKSRKQDKNPQGASKINNTRNKFHISNPSFLNSPACGTATADLLLGCDDDVDGGGGGGGKPLKIKSLENSSTEEKARKNLCCCCCSMNLHRQIQSYSWNNLKRKYFLSKIKANNSGPNLRAAGGGGCDNNCSIPNCCNCNDYCNNCNNTNGKTIAICKNSAGIGTDDAAGSVWKHYSRACSSDCFRERQTVIRMLCLIVLVFAICNFPFHMRKIVLYWWPNFNYKSHVGILFIPLTQLLMYTNCAVNPIIYFFMSKSFRACVSDLWKRFRGACYNSSHWNSNSSSNTHNVL